MAWASSATTTHDEAAPTSQDSKSDLVVK